MVGLAYNFCHVTCLAHGLKENVPRAYSKFLFPKIIFPTVPKLKTYCLIVQKWLF